MSTKSIEAREYDELWGKPDYSAAQIGYTPNFLRFMDAGLRRLAPAGWVAPSDTTTASTPPANAAVLPLRGLEVGCGDGFFTGQLARRIVDANGVDLSDVGLDLARQRYPQAKFLQHDLSNPLPFPDASFGFVWCSEVLEHLFSPLAVLKEIARVLKPGGEFRCTVPYHGLLKNLGIALFAFERHYDPEYPHIRFFTQKSLAGLASKAGLRVTEVGACGSNLGWRDVLVKTNILLAATR
jgi:SAM-dependent methyltransferase